MEGLEASDKQYVGAFRGEPGLEHLQVKVDANRGVDSGQVAEELARFEEKLQALVAELDAVLPAGEEPDADQLAAIVDLCAWAHSEWVRIHPFANGNGRTARLWANSSGDSLWLAAFCPLTSASRRRLRRGRCQGDAGRLEVNRRGFSPVAG